MNITRQQALEWRQAMASGKYKHIAGSMFHTGCHCALGVLADVNGIPMRDQYLNSLANREAWQWVDWNLGTDEMSATWMKNDFDEMGELGKDYSRVIAYLDTAWGFTSEELASHQLAG